MYEPEENTRKYYSKDWLKTEYLEKDRGVNEIADECEVSTSAISKFIEKYDLYQKIPDEADYKDPSWLKQKFHEENMNMAEMARCSEHNTSRQNIRKWLIRYDLLYPEWD